MPVPAVKGSVLQVSAITPDGRVSFSSKVQGIVTKPFYMLVISIPEALSHEQVRQFYRVPVHLRVKFLLMNKITEEDTIHYEEGLVDDISGGGCRLSTGAELSEGDNLLIDFAGTAMDNVGRVECRINRISPKQGNKIVASLRFHEIDDLTEDRIVRYVFRRQLELRKFSS